jgi:hypothetical protein
MEIAAVPAGETTRPGPLAALALVVAIPATFILSQPDALARWLFDGAGGTTYRGEALLGLLVLAGGIGAVLLVGRGTLGVRRTLILMIATWLTLALASFVLFIAAFADAFGDCGGGTHHPLTAWVVVAAGVVYVAAAYWALRKGWWWGVPLAVVLALVFCFILAEALPAVPKSTDACSD